jgi:hypothetical protein
MSRRARRPSWSWLQSAMLLAVISLTVWTCGALEQGNGTRDSWLVGGQGGGIRVGFEGDTICLELIGRGGPAARLSCGPGAMLCLGHGDAMVWMGTEAGVPGLGRGAQGPRFSCGYKVATWSAGKRVVELGWLGECGGLHLGLPRPSGEMEVDHLVDGVSIGCADAACDAHAGPKLFLRSTSKLSEIILGGEVGLVAFGAGHRSDRAEESAFLAMGKTTLEASAGSACLAMGFDAKARVNPVLMGVVDGRAGFQVKDLEKKKTFGGFEKER